MFYVYVLFSQTAARYYIGQTEDLIDRLNRHNSGYEFSTSPYRPWLLVCVIEKKTRSEAVILERKLKNLNSEDLNKFIKKYGSNNGGREA